MVAHTCQLSNQNRLVEMREQMSAPLLSLSAAKYQILPFGDITSGSRIKFLAPKCTQLAPKLKTVKPATFKHWQSWATYTIRTGKLAGRQPPIPSHASLQNP